METSITKVSVGAIIIKGGKTLLAQRKGELGKGKWGTMGGHLEYGETPTQAIVREAKEELGIEIGNLKFLICSDIRWRDKQYIDVTFLADIISGEPKNMEPDKISTVGWYDLNNLPEPLFEPVKAALEAVKSGNHYFEIKAE